MDKKSIKCYLVLMILLLVSSLFAATPQEAFVYISPIPYSELILKETTLLFRTGEYFTTQDYVNFSDVTIEGDSSGVIEFEVIPSDDDFTAILDPYNDLKPGEIVTVTFSNITIGSSTVTGSYYFTISTGATDTPSLEFKKLIKDEFYSDLPVKNNLDIDPGMILDNEASLPSDFPARALITNDSPDSGYVFVATYGRDAGTPYIMILDNDAYPVYYKKMTDWTWDFKVHPNGLLTYIVEDTPYWYIMDSTYTIIDSVRAMNGYFSDEHDIQILDNGHILVGAYDIQSIEDDPTSPTSSKIQIAGYIIQELDSNKNVVFQWRCWDYLDMGLSELTTDDSRYSDPLHGNTLELDNDGNLLTCFRNLEQFTKINMITGDIIWKLGGTESDFEIVNYPQGWSRPHDIRRLDNGHITIYDNARLQSDPYNNSGPVEFVLDTTAMTCTMVWEFKKEEGVYGPFMGNGQRLSNGNTMVGWGGRAPLTATECRQDSTVAWEMTFSLYDDHRIYSYRSFRFPWHGVAAVPYLIVDQADTLIHMVFNKFGDSTVAYYNIYADYTPNPTALYGTTTENHAYIYDLFSDIIYIRVTAVDTDGNESDYSNEEYVTIDFPNTYLPGDVNMAAGLWPPLVVGGDVTYLVNYFRGLESAQECLINDFYCSADVTGDCSVLSGDVTYLVNYLRGLNEMQYCPSYPPAWLSNSDVPDSPYSNWPPCE